MNAQTPRAAWMCWVAIAVIGLAASVFAQSTATRPAAPSPAEGSAAMGPRVGTVTGNNVYVRSGSDRNYYAVAKLNRGDEVTIVGERFGWLEILPPPGAYSLVDKDYVDLVDDKMGVLNGKTWVQAGSDLAERHYAKQVKLDKGDRVRVIGQTADGKFCKIAPPRGAHLWISGDYVTPGRKVTRAEGPLPRVIETVKPGELRLPQAPPTVKEPGTPPLPTVEPSLTLPASPHVPGLETDGKYRPLIDGIEKDIAAEQAKPPKDRILEPIIRKLRPIAEQGDDEMAKLYAQARIRQLQSYIELVEAVQEMRELRAKSVSTAEAMRLEREKIEAALAANDIVVRGEIRVSSIYNGSGRRPKRWRIVEPGARPTKTLAYIEVPPGSPIDPIQYYGRHVGIRASARRVLNSSGSPVPVYTVQEIKVLSPAGQSDRTSGSAVSASPSPEKVTAPSSQPASSSPGAALSDQDKK